MVASPSAEPLQAGHQRQSHLPLEGGENLLLQEINHRMLNTLTAISLGFERDLNSLGCSHGRHLLQHTQRILDHAEIYRCLCLPEGGGNIAVDEYLSRLCRYLAKAILMPIGVECGVVFEPGLLCSSQCERLGMIVSELVFNAAKHAFDGRQGWVHIAFRRHGEEWWCSVEDNGRGFGIPKAGAGGRIVKALVASLGGTVSAASGSAGATITVYVPASRVAPSTSVANCLSD